MSRQRFYTYFCLIALSLSAACIGDPNQIVFPGADAGGEDVGPTSDIRDGDADIEGDGGDIPGPDFNDLEYAEQVIIDVLCHMSWECADSSPFMREVALKGPLRFDSLEDCTARGREYIDFFDFEDLRPGVEAERFIIDPAYYEACLDELNRILCHGILHSLPEPCENFLQPQMGKGDRCSNGFECGPGLACDKGAEPDECYGRCVDEPVVQCDESDECDPGWQCNDEGECEPAIRECVDNDSCAGERVCMLDRCESPLPFVGEGQECGGGQFCQPGLLCIKGSEDNAFCQKARVQGEECIETGECGIGYYCQIPVDGSRDAEVPGICEPLISNGGGCRDNKECLSNYCDEGRCAVEASCEF